MRRFFEKYFQTVVIFLVTLISLLLIISAVSMLSQYAKEVSDQAYSKASYHTLSTRYTVEQNITDAEMKSVIAVNSVAKAENSTDLYVFLSKINKQKGYEDVLFARYFNKDGVLCSDAGEVIATEDPSRDYYQNGTTKPTYIGSFEDASTVSGMMSLIGFYVPTPESDLTDAIVIYYTRSKLTSFFPEDEVIEHAEFSVLSTIGGTIVSGLKSVDGNQLFDMLREKIGEKAPIDQIQNLMHNRTDGIVLTEIQGKDYLISVGANEENLHDLCVVQMFPVQELCSTGIGFVNAIISIVVIFALIAVCVVIYLIIHRRQMKRTLFHLETKCEEMECLNRHGFEEEAERILERNPNSYFAVVVVHLRHYKYLMETYGESETNRLIGYIRLTCHNTARVEETYGYMGKGEFLLLLHAKDQHGLIERLKMNASLATHYKGSYTFDVSLKYGIYEYEREEKNVTVNQMVEYAVEANNSITRATSQNASMQFNFYNNELRKIRMINEDMELRMEGALQNGEFQVFYQPKYNLNLGRQDGSEALVRWYDPKTNEYNRPALFMPLFETNGFIVKLDRYVYTKVCEYISYSIANGRPVFPVSVNVSRITAVQPDFIEFYSRIKRKYGITDGQIMIEFTESFAYENYEILIEITNQLHKNGFRCSIDDFGCGYSSYQILKSLPMDEIKLDKFFIEGGLSNERDYFVIESIINVAKKLKMKVTQEGVENLDDVVELKKLGCDVIQGYYYSHPLSLSDYINFVAETKEHNINLDPYLDSDNKHR